MWGAFLLNINVFVCVCLFIGSEDKYLFNLSTADKALCKEAFLQRQIAAWSLEHNEW
jgi:hypothetical protein